MAHRCRSRRRPSHQVTLIKTAVKNRFIFTMKYGHTYTKSETYKVVIDVTGFDKND
jgi:hypothetical protein